MTIYAKIITLAAVLVALAVGAQAQTPEIDALRARAEHAARDAPTVARDTEESWRRDAILRRHRHWQHAVSWWGGGAEIPPPRWDPTCESREDYQQRHERYLQMLETQAEQDGLVDAPIKHAPEHFEWLALYHFGKWTVERIADEFGGKRGL